MRKNAVETEQAGGEADGETRARPIREVYGRLGVSLGKGQQLVNAGELETFTIGKRRYATDGAVQRFIEKRVEESLKESSTDRARKVAKAVEGRRRQRERQA